MDCPLRKSKATVSAKEVATIQPNSAPEVDIRESAVLLLCSGLMITGCTVADMFGSKRCAAGGEGEGK
jgi:hypothetical protein|tara:strand:+ start:451 stop:654 length:204 start_codon:yes stop_codon:yes gene_type:complete